MAAQICETCKWKGARCYCAPNSTCESYEPEAATWFEKIKLMDIEKLSEWLDQYGRFDNSPWLEWWNATYCERCEPVIAFVPYLNGEHECAYCETNDKCRFFENGVPDNKEMIKMWLESEIDAKSVDS